MVWTKARSGRKRPSRRGWGHSMLSVSDRLHDFKTWLCSLIFLLVSLLPRWCTSALMIEIYSENQTYILLALPPRRPNHRASPRNMSPPNLLRASSMVARSPKPSFQRGKRRLPRPANKPRHCRCYEMSGSPHQRTGCVGRSNISRQYAEERSYGLGTMGWCEGCASIA